MNDPPVAVLTAAERPAARERELAERFGLPLLAPGGAAPPDGRPLLRFGPEGLGLHMEADGAPAVLRADFLAPGIQRRARAPLAGQLLGRAAGLRRGRRPGVLDATAGLGRDAFLLARAGCEVLLLERSAAVCALLEDGMRRASEGSGPTARALARMRLVHADFLEYAGDGPRDVVLLDPMFVRGPKAARAKQPMFLLQRLLGEPGDGGRLLERALGAARGRVVAKRPRAAPALAGRPPDLAFRGSSSRFDVYLMGSARQRPAG